MDMKPDGSLPGLTSLLTALGIGLQKLADAITLHYLSRVESERQLRLAEGETFPPSRCRQPLAPNELMPTPLGTALDTTLEKAAEPPWNDKSLSTSDGNGFPHSRHLNYPTWPSPVAMERGGITIRVQDMVGSPISM
ncbi:MAG: hypothetical protein V1793_19845 [Pseudomonadota bacterium]